MRTKINALLDQKQYYTITTLVPHQYHISTKIAPHQYQTISHLEDPIKRLQKIESHSSIVPPINSMVLIIIQLDRIHLQNISKCSILSSETKISVLKIFYRILLLLYLGIGGAIFDQTYSARAHQVQSDLSPDQCPGQP